MLKHKELQHLPEHVVLNILCRLPVKSLIRFTCVSKRWRSVIISDPQFGNSHFQLQLAASQLRHNVFISKSASSIPFGTPKGEPETLLPFGFQSLEDKFSIKNLNCPFQRCSRILVMGSCNGLVVLANFHPIFMVSLGQPCCDHYSSLVMWNPSTGFFRNIPCPNFQIGMIKLTDEDNGIGVYYGFGQVSASDDYKLVVIPNLGVLMEVQVFSVRANCWKVVKAPYLSPYRPWSEELGTYSNGAIHWVSNREPGIFEPPVYAFDLANEEFREMPLPVLSRNEDGMEMTQIRTQVLLGGCLCVMFQDVMPQDAKKYTEFWMMKEYGRPESWVKLFGFNIHDLPDVFDSFFSRLFWNPIFIAEDGTVVIKLRTQMELIWIKCRKEEKPVCTDRYCLEEVPEHRGLRLIAKKAISKNTGARGLRAILETILTDTMYEIPDVRTGDDMIDAVVIDEEAVGTDGQGCGAKILYGKGALDQYLSQNKEKDVQIATTEGSDVDPEGEAEFLLLLLACNFMWKLICIAILYISNIYLIDHIKLVLYNSFTRFGSRAVGTLCKSHQIVYGKSLIVIFVKNDCFFDRVYSVYDCFIASMFRDNVICLPICILRHRCLISPNLSGTEIYLSTKSIFK